VVSEYLVVLAIVASGLAGVPGLVRPRQSRAGERLFTVLMTAAGVFAAAAAAGTLASGASPGLALPWSVPAGRLSIRVDALAAMFVLHVAVLSTAGAWYGLEYWAQRAHADSGRKLRVFYGTATAGMLLLIVAGNAILFLVGWEIMALSTFMLVSTEDTKASVREVGYIYLLATRAGALCLFATFALAGAAAGTLDLGAWPRALASPLRDGIFILGLCGFGLKAGIMPLHIWLPGAHGNAPSHVSALMSGAVIKMGIYGLVRLTAACDAPPLWWGYGLLAAGAVSSVLGVGFAIGQHDLKRLLAYHSVENIGIICMGLGVAVLGRSLGHPDLIALGVAGALLHVWNHGLFKSLLFLSAGSVLHATGTRDIDRLGGLWRRMPRTALAFLVGAIAICGLPPLNGLISELLVYLGLFRIGVEAGTPWRVGALAAPALALTGALAVACFVKVIGAVFLGTPRRDDGARAHDPGPAMLAPMAVLSAACLFIALAAPLVARALDGAVAAWGGPEVAGAPALGAIAPLGWISLANAGLLLALVLVGRALVRAARREGAPPVATWDCGYAAPTARMQYTASSFADMLVGVLRPVLRPSAAAPRLDAPFPGPAAYHSELPDVVLDRALRPSFAFAGRLLARLRPFQRGSIHLYLVYILATVVALLLWR
jgi:hydrogenase-4 component B